VPRPTGCAPIDSFKSWDLQVVGATVRPPQIVGAVQPPPCLVCDAFQAKHVREKYRNLRRWYEDFALKTMGEQESIGHWGVSYAEYAEFVAEVAGGMELRAGDAVFESAVGNGWLLRGLRQELTAEVADTLRLAGNDIIPMALDLAQARLASDGAPPPVLCLGDSANLTGWVERGSFDAVLCGYLEPNTGGHEWAGNWVRQMAWCARPGGLVFLGNNFAPTPQRPGTSGSGVLPLSWWRDAAVSDKYGWGVEPESVRLQPLRSPALRAAWGERYSVFMRKAGGE
jgi:hypothetical protein